MLERAGCQLGIPAVRGEALPFICRRLSTPVALGSRADLPGYDAPTFTLMPVGYTLKKSPAQGGRSGTRRQFPGEFSLCTGYYSTTTFTPEPLPQEGVFDVFDAFDRFE